MTVSHASFKQRVLRWLDALGPARSLSVVAFDTLPDRLPWRSVVLTNDDGEPWSVGMRCPCRCGTRVEVLVDPLAAPHWTVIVDSRNRPTLNPSVWLDGGCRSHFWLREGRIEWCD